MTSLARLSLASLNLERTHQDFVEGCEFAGYLNSTNQRVCGMFLGGCISNKTLADSTMLINVPDQWTLEEAATVPCVYNTVLYSLITVSHLRV